jgi:hypothetical protein
LQLKLKSEGLMGRLAFVVLAFVTLFGGAGSADEMARQKIMFCEQTVTLNEASLEACSGYYVPPYILGSCTQSGPCEPLSLDEANRRFTPIQKQAQQCAMLSRGGFDPNGSVGVFAGCMNSQIVLSPSSHKVLDCAVSSTDVPTFANCAAPNYGVSLTDYQLTMTRCAVDASGDTSDFADCASKKLLEGRLTDDERFMLNCAKSASQNERQFRNCVARRLSSGRLSDDEQTLVNCALDSSGDKDDFTECAGDKVIGQTLTPDQRALVRCARDGDAEDFAVCAGERLVGDSLPDDQRQVVELAARCAAQSTDGAQFAACAGANLFNLSLNPEQQIGVECIVQSGGQPYAAAGCIATRLTEREIEKCLSGQVGGADGCFGDNNDLVGKKGWVSRTMGQIAGGPNSVINNPGQIWGGNNSFLRNPGQIWGGNNSFVRNPSQFWGGNNSVFNNPSQLNVTVGTVGGHRVCFPWC